MGYTTDFAGEFSVTPRLEEKHAKYLQTFSKTRRMKRDATEASKLPDPIREAVELPVGEEGAYFVGGSGFMGQGDDISVKDHNTPPCYRQNEMWSQPGLWCQWVPSENRSSIKWDGSEKFYEYVTWLQYIIDNFLSPWGYDLNGEVKWQGEDGEDFGVIVVKNNRIYEQPGRKEAGPLHDSALQGDEHTP